MKRIIITDNVIRSNDALNGEAAYEIGTTGDAYAMGTIIQTDI